MQLNNLRDYVSSCGWDNAGEYVDTGWSGANASRPQLDKLMRDARLTLKNALRSGLEDTSARGHAHSTYTEGRHYSRGIDGLWLGAHAGPRTAAGSISAPIGAAGLKTEKHPLKAVPMCKSRNPVAAGKRSSRPMARRSTLPDHGNLARAGRSPRRRVYKLIY
jgi:hypothetical protein